MYKDIIIINGAIQTDSLVLVCCKKNDDGKKKINMYKDIIITAKLIRKTKSG